MNISLIQMTSKQDITLNINKAISLISESCEKYNTDIVALPENFPYMITEGDVPEIEDGLYDKVINNISEIAKKYNVNIIAGTIPEPSGDGRFYNTSTVINREGDIIAKYSKIHLFDIELEKKDLKESKYIKAGKEVVTFDIDGYFNCGLSICYDLRFPELYRRIMDTNRVHAFFVPSAFTMRTGKDHWEVLLRARAIENMAYVFAPAQFGKHDENRESYGHSMIIDPWGTVIARKGDGEGIINTEINIDYIKKVRARIPALDNRKIK